jgi:anti-sigma factor RsiW
MECFDEREAMLFLDGELPEEKARQISDHLKRCRQCGELVQRLREENTGISNLFALDHRIPDQTQLILKRIRTDRQFLSGPARFHLPYFGWGLRVAAAVLLIFVLFVFIFIKKEPAVSGLDNGVLLQTARVDGHSVQTHIFSSGDEDITFIWLEKI